jgi:hypothetical protein
VRGVAFDQDDVEALAPELRAEPSNELQPAGPAPDHDDLRLQRALSRLDLRLFGS